MRKLFLIAAGLAASGAFIGMDAVHAFVDKTRASVRSTLMSPEMEMRSKMAEAQRLDERCASSVIEGRVALARLQSMINAREQEQARREAALARDRTVLETRKAMLGENRAVYLIHNEEVSRATLNRDAALRARAFATDRDTCDQLRECVLELKAQSAQTAAEIEEATVEQARLEQEVSALRAEMENLTARRAVARTREEAAGIFDRSTFDRARDKIAEIRASIAEQNKRLDFYGRSAPHSRGLIPDDSVETEQSGLDAIDQVLAAPPEATLQR